MGEKILIVDDEESISASLREILGEHGYEIDTAYNGKKAVESYRKALKDKPYQLILLDIVMPRMSGLEVLAAIRREEKEKGIDPKKGIPIIMLSGLNESWMTDAFQDGCNDYIVKPYAIPVLLAKIKAMLSKP